MTWRLLARAAFLALLSALGAQAAPADRVELELWCDLDPVVKEPDSPGRVSPEDALRRMLEEARSVLSGMIYGYRFVYTPSDAARRIDETFLLIPEAEIRPGDERLSVAGTRLESTRLFVLLRYELSPEQRDRRLAWQSSSASKAGGVGSGNVFLGYRERMSALNDAVKQAIRDHLRPQVPNKPREVRGELVIWEVPGTSVSAGEYHTRVVTRLRVTSLVPYRVY